MKLNLEKLRGHMLDTEVQRLQILEETKQKCVRLILTIVDEVIGEAVKTNPNSFIHRIEKGLDLLANQAEIHLSVNPNDQHLVSEYLSSTSSKLKCNTISLVTDESLTLGSAKLICRNIVVTSDIHNHLEAIKTRLLDKNGANQIPTHEGI